MNLEELKASNCIIFECISGSKAYGLATETSDVDIRGVFILPLEQFYSFDYQEEIHDERQNIIYYELRKFLGLLAKNNPNMLELLNIPDDCILFKHSLFNKIKPENFLSKLCRDTFVGYAMSQFRKARGLNKKILNPVDKAHKNILDFCYVLEEGSSIPLLTFLKNAELSQEHCGLVAVPHMRGLYAVYYSQEGIYRGLVHNDKSMELILSSVPKGEKPIATITFNQDGFSRYCKDYKEYWDWVENRNQDRFQNTIEHGKNYDAKNIMHLFRLLMMSEEIGRSGQIVVRSPHREQLLKIRKGEFYYEELEAKVVSKVHEIEKLYDHSTLPDQPDIQLINDLLIDIRKEFYSFSG